MRTPRLYLDDRLTAGRELLITHDRAHYLRNVMRLRPGDAVLLFNAEDGEWQASLSRIERRDVVLTVETQSRPAEEQTGPQLYFAPLKRPRMEILIEKSVELGVRRLSPVLTAHTVVERINPSRLHARVVEAAEQSQRLTLPALDEPMALDDLPSDRPIIMADEHGGGLPLLQALDRQPEAALLIGPEGGFSLEERDDLRGRANIHTASLGATILRAETAAIFALSVWRAWSDDCDEE